MDYDNITPTMLAWTAGFLDGEGCLTLFKSRNTKGYLGYSPRVTVGQLDLRPLRRLVEMWGGWVSSSGRACQWDLRGQKATTMLQLVRPYLVLKGEQADVLLEYQGWLKQDREDIRRRLTLLKSRAS